MLYIIIKPDRYKESQLSWCQKNTIHNQALSAITQFKYNWEKIGLTKNIKIKQ